MIILSHESVNQHDPVVSIKVVGLGGAGGNILNYIIDSGFSGAEFVAVNTDIQALGLSKAQYKVQVGIKSTKGQGSGANPETGKRAIEEDLEKVLEAIGAADIVFLIGGGGGGTGSGALPVIAKALKERNILCVVVVTKPFTFEGKRRDLVAQSMIDTLKTAVDTLIVIPNQKLLDVVDQRVSMIDAFGMINNVVCQSVRGISEIITKPGHINVDYADVRAIMRDRGLAVMGTGRASGANRAEEAALQAISSPLFENVSIEGAQAVLLNITGGSNLSLHEISRAASLVHELAHEDANIILGSVIDESMKDEVMITLIATGFEKTVQKAVSSQAQEQPIQMVNGIGVAKKDEHITIERVVKNEPNNPQVASSVHQPLPTAYDRAIASEYSGFQKGTANSESMQQYQDGSASSLDIPTFLRNKQKHDPNGW